MTRPRQQKNFYNMFSRFDRILEHDRQIDRQTDEICVSTVRAVNSTERQKLPENDGDSVLKEMITFQTPKPLIIISNYSR